MDSDPGTTAVVHGMLATMAEVLERLEERLSALEGTIVGQTTATRTAAQRLASELPEAVVEPLRERLARLDGLDARLAGVEEAVTKPDTSALEARIAALAEAVTDGRPDLSGLESRLDALVTPDLGVLEARLEAVAAASPDLGPIEDRLDALAAAVASRLDGLAAAMPDLAPIAARVDHLAHATPDLSAVEARLAAIAESVPDLSAVEARMEALASSLDARLDALAGAVAATQVSPGAVAAEVRAAVAEAGAEAEERLDRLAEVVTGPMPELGALLDERLPAVTAGIAELLATAGAGPADPTAVALGLARLEADLAEARAESAMALQAVAERVEAAFLGARASDEEALRRAVAALEAVAAQAQAHASANASANGNVPDRDEVANRLSQLHDALNRSRGETTTAVDGMAARLARLEAVVASAGEDDEARATSLVSELHAILGAGLERVLTHATAAAHDDGVAADVRTSVNRLTELTAGIDAVASTVTSMADAVARLVADDRNRPVVAAVEAAAREQHEALGSLHTSLVRRIDGRTAALARLLEGVDVDRIATEMAERQSSTTRLLEQVAAGLGDEQRRLETVQSLCQSVAGAVEQQAAVGSRVAELVLETRSAMRSDVERLESGLHLDSVKRHQHDQARLAQVTAGVTEVVERETALVAQRVAALASTVEALRNALHVHADGMAGAAG